MAIDVDYAWRLLLQAIRENRVHIGDFHQVVVDKGGKGALMDRDRKIHSNREGIVPEDELQQPGHGGIQWLLLHVH